MERYKLLREIGKGATCRVFLAADQRDGRRYAVKRYDSRGEFEEARRRFQVVRGLKHPGIPALAEIAAEGEGGFIVMEYVPGMTLKQRIYREGKISEEQAVRWGLELCDILSYIHRQDPAVIYRDLKPGNIMITPLSHVKLIDFGAALFSRKQEIRAAVPVGTKGYAAPEQFVRNGLIDTRADLYGLGAVLFHMLTGHHPAETESSLADAVAGARRISKGMKKILSRCVSVNRDERYRFSEEIKRDLANPEAALKEPGSFRILRSEICCPCDETGGRGGAVNSLYC